MRLIVVMWIAIAAFGCFLFAVIGELSGTIAALALFIIVGMKVTARQLYTLANHQPPPPPDQTGQPANLNRRPR